MPHIVFPKYATPDIGEVRFVANSSIGSAGYLSTDESKGYLVQDTETGGWWAYPRG